MRVVDPLKQRNQLFHNEGGRRFADVTERAGAACTPRRVSRGLAAGDLDNDGGVDLVIFNNNGPVRVLLNEAARRRHWLGVRGVDGRGRDALDTPVELARGRARLRRRVHVDGSYAVASDPRIVFGLGDDAGMQTVRVSWRDGRVESFSGLAVDRYWVLEAGKPPRPRVRLAPASWPIGGLSISMRPPRSGAWQSVHTPTTVTRCRPRASTAESAGTSRRASGIE